tara:strand:+ start:1048 stop:1452 length:405 start_codon:yes stop_codon:yes gene_type:complete
MEKAIEHLKDALANIYAVSKKYPSTYPENKKREIEKFRHIQKFMIGKSMTYGSDWENIIIDDLKNKLHKDEYKLFLAFSNLLSVQQKGETKKIKRVQKTKLGKWKPKNLKNRQFKFVKEKKGARLRRLKRLKEK